MKLSAIILEDEPFASKRLKRMIEEIAHDINVIEIFESIEDTANYLLENEHPDMLFVDIHVADGNSFELFKILDISSKVIFTTAFDKYAIEAFRKNATDYLLKPINRDQLAEAIEKATPLNMESKDILLEKYKNRFLIKFGAKLYTVKSTDIAYIFSKNKVTYFCTFDGDRIASDYILQDLETMLDPNLFFRANRQFIVHIESITKMQRHGASRVKLSLNPSISEEIVVSTDKTRIFKKWLGK
jgi:DNA-binding LytR/AlgR family response regulator